MQDKFSILMVEDSDEDFYATTRTLARFRDFDVNRCTKGTEVLPHLLQLNAPSNLPHLILLDLNLPGALNGKAILAELKSHDRLRRIPVVISTTSENPKDIQHCYHHGAGGYMVKPVDLDRFSDSIHAMVSYWFESVTLPAVTGS